MVKKEEKEEIVVKEKSDFIVKDQQVLRPVELPLVITPQNGKWASKAQEEFAKVLNAYAYTNPTKWAVKKDKLLAELKEKENAPDPVEPSVKFTNNFMK